MISKMTIRTNLPLLFLLVLPFGIGSAQQVTGQDLDKILERADKLLDEAKGAYEEARTKSSVAAFIDAGFKLEEARIKFIVLQEIGSPEKQKIASDRMRAINQLNKLIHDGKVAISAPPAEPSSPKSVDPSPAPVIPPPPPTPNPQKPADVTARAAIPEAAKQAAAEKLVKELFKEQYSKKAQADRHELSRRLLEEASKSANDPDSLWVLFREAQEVAVQSCNVTLAIAAIESASQVFDLDPLPMKSAALLAVGKTARTPEEFATLTNALLRLANDLIAADLYEAADKACVSAVQHAKKCGDTALSARASIRAKEILEAKTRYQGMKGVLETLAKNSDDPGANSEMGQFLCFVKINWDLGLRFLIKGVEPMKGLAKKEIEMPLHTDSLLAAADGWWDLSEKEKSPLRKGQMLAHARTLYEGELERTTGLVRTKVERRLAELDLKIDGTVNLLSMIDTKLDTVAGQWTLDSGGLTCSAGQGVRLQIPYRPPDEYDLTILLSRLGGTDNISVGLVGGGAQFNCFFDAYPGKGGMTLLGDINGGVPPEKNPTTVPQRFLTGSQVHTIICSIRRGGVSISVDGKKAIVWQGDFKRFSVEPYWKLPDTRTLSVGAWDTSIQITRLVLTQVSGQGKKLRQ